MRYVKGPYPFRPGNKVGKVLAKLYQTKVNEKATLVLKRLAKRIVRLENLMINRYGYSPELFGRGKNS